MVFVYFYKFRKSIKLESKVFKSIFNILKEKWYFDKVYNFLFVKKLSSFSMFLWSFVDKKVIDGLGPLGMSFSVYSVSKYLREFQNGKIFSYATFMFIGIIAFFILIFFSF